MGRLKKYWKELVNFGLIYFLKRRVVSRWKGRGYKNQLILDFLKENVVRYSNSARSYGVNPNVGPQPIWTCWWQGEDKMPQIVQTCYHSICQHSNGHKVYLITKENIASYVSVPSEIIEKYNKGLISLTHFSDVIRFCLLSAYGGLWVDATVFCTGDIPSHIPHFFSLKKQPGEDYFVSNYRWSGYFIGGSEDNVLFDLLANCYFRYWTQYNYLIDYYLMDYLITDLYDINNDVSSMIDSLPFSNPNALFLTYHLNDSYDESVFDEIISDTAFHKLSWKGHHELCAQNGELTYWGKILGCE